MAIFVFAAFVLTPIVEIFVFLQVGGVIGVWPTISIVILTAMLGTALLRHQGLKTLQRFQDSLNQNVLPVAEVFDGLCLLVAGALLLTPGFVTDTIGFLLFVPPIRRAVQRGIGSYLRNSGRIHVVHGGPGGWERGPGPDRGRRPDGTIIEGEYEEIDPNARKLR